MSNKGNGVSQGYPNTEIVWIADEGYSFDYLLYMCGLHVRSNYMMLALFGLKSSAK